MKRFITSCRLGECIKLTGSEHHHLAHVVRVRVGDNVIMTNGDAFDYKYNIVSITRDCATLEFISKIKNKQNPKKNLTVFIGLIKPENLAWVVEKLNEIGASELVPFVCANSNTRSINIEKLREISRQSCKQCGRSVPLQIHDTISFRQMLHEIPNFDNAFYADRGEKRDRISLSQISNSDYNALIIGTEGGFTLEENLAVTDVATPFTLGARTLRSETAAIVASTLILNLMGEI